MIAHITKTWIEDGKLVTEVIEAKDVYKREWVGLTEKEVDNCYESIMFNPDIEPTRMGVYLEIEAKLKEKNT